MKTSMHSYLTYGIESGENDLITDMVADSAELRAKAIEAARMQCFTSSAPVVVDIIVRLYSILCSGKFSSASSNYY
jgi:hypothetical protein